MTTFCRLAGLRTSVLVVVLALCSVPLSAHAKDGTKKGAGQVPDKRRFFDLYAAKKNDGYNVAAAERLFYGKTGKGTPDSSVHEEAIRLLESAGKRDNLERMRSLVMEITGLTVSYARLEAASEAAIRARKYENVVDRATGEMPVSWGEIESVWSSYASLYNALRVDVDDMDRLSDEVARLAGLLGSADNTLARATSPDPNSTNMFGQSVDFGVMLRSPDIIGRHKLKILKMIGIDFVVGAEINWKYVDHGSGELNRAGISEDLSLYEAEGFRYGVEFGPVYGNDRVGASGLTSEQLQDNLRFVEELGDFLSERSGLMFVEFFNEPERLLLQKTAVLQEQKPLFADRFVEYLRETYSDVNALNSDMGTHYERFSEVVEEVGGTSFLPAGKGSPENSGFKKELPPKPGLSKLEQGKMPPKKPWKKALHKKQLPQKKLPPKKPRSGKKGMETLSPELLVLLNRFRTRSLEKLCHEVIDAWKKEAPGCPVSPQFSTMLFDGALDYALLDLPWDAVGMHVGGGGKPGHADNALAFARSMSALTGKPCWSDEFIYNGIEGRKQEDEYLLMHVVRRNIWQHYASGLKTLEFFEADGSYEDWNDYMLDQSTGYETPRPSACVIGTVRDALTRIDSRIDETLLPKPDVLVLYSPDSCAAGISGDIGASVNWLLEKCLADRDVQYAFVPVSEFGKLNVNSVFNDAGIVIAPATIWVNRDESLALDRWVRDGGTLVAIGPFGIYPETSSDLEGIRSVPGLCECGLSRERLAGFAESMRRGRMIESVKARIGLDKGGASSRIDLENVRDTVHGKGRLVFMTSVDCGASEIRNVVNSTVPAPGIQSDSPEDTDLTVMRGVRSGKTYAFVVNLDVRSCRTIRIGLDSAACIQDLESGADVADGKAVEQFDVFLGPGGGAALRLDAKEDTQEE